jgi:hypothetical protein
MRLSGTHAATRRIWTVELRPQPGGPTLTCPHCAAYNPRPQAASARSAALTHLARHARADALPAHLRTCAPAHLSVPGTGLPLAPPPPRLLRSGAARADL